ncbi:MAG: hypothetical protein WBA09_22540 [Candidatus Acidiferrum sp.]
MFGPPLIKQLEKAGLRVQQFDPYHHRVNGEIDVWTNAQGRALSWHDRFTGDRGHIPEDQVVQFLKRRLDREPSDCTREEFMSRLMQIGWSYEESEKSWKERSSSARQESAESPTT